MKPTFARRFIAGVLGLVSVVAFTSSAQAAGEVKHPREVNGSWEGPFGRFDRAQLQRGFQVYKEVCSGCHSMNLLHYRNLGDEHGPFYDPKYPNPNENPVIKAIAATYTVKAVDPDGNEEERPGLPSDKFVSPFENRAQAAAANGGAVPPDMSALVKARHVGGDYIYSLLTGYDQEPPKGKVIPEGKHYNPYMPGGVIAMGPPLVDEQVTYADTEANKGVKPTVDQMSHDVVAFLSWASEPHQTERKITGFGVMAFLLVLTILLWFSYRQVWRNVEH
ncbi:MAG: cytochrome c1 [Alphaproteobacteria bacterium PA3]|nr:MAG: cytochrome c1 [Alphaproteobacteria bacterium PA3]